jgi:hypothetical protein
MHKFGVGSKGCLVMHTGRIAQGWVAVGRG